MSCGRFLSGNGPNSVGLPRVSNQNSKLVFISKSKQRYTGLFCHFTVHLTRSATEGILKAQQNQEGDYRYCHGIPLFGKNTMSKFSKYQKLYTIDFQARLRYISQFTVHSTTKPKGEYRCTVYCHGIPLYGKKKSRFSFVLVLDDVFPF